MNKKIFIIGFVLSGLILTCVYAIFGISFHDFITNDYAMNTVFLSFGLLGILMSFAIFSLFGEKFRKNKEDKGV